MNKKTVIELIALCVVCFLVGGLVVYASTPSTIQTFSGGIMLGPSYTIYNVGSNYYAKDQNGVIDYSGMDVQTVTQNALDALTSGGSVYWSSGTFSYDGRIDVENDDVTLAGLGDSVLTFTTATAGTHSINITGDGVTVKHLTVTRSKKTAIISTGDDVTIEDCTITYATLQGINVAGSNLLVTNNRIDNVTGEFGIVLGGLVQHALITNNLITDVGKEGIQWGYSGSDVVISNNVINECASVAGGETPGGITVLGAEWDGYSGTHNVIIANNIVNNSEANGIQCLYRAATPPADGMTNFLIDGNLLSDIPGYGMRIDDNVQNITIQNNVLVEIGNAGIACLQDAVVIKNNYIDTVTFDAIYLPVASAYTSLHITDNILQNYGRDPIRNVGEVGAGNKIERNTGIVTEASGSSTGTGGEQTIAHGLSGIPDIVILSNGDAASNPYQSSAADATNIYVTADNGETWFYLAIYKP